MPRKKEPVETPATDRPITFRVPVEWYEDLRRRAYERRTTITDEIRAALRGTYGYEDPPEREGTS